jgi:prolyl 4-hydroxylase
MKSSIVIFGDSAKMGPLAPGISIKRIFFACLPAICSILFFRWAVIVDYIDQSGLLPEHLSSHKSPADKSNASKADLFDNLAISYEHKCPPHRYQTRIFSLDPLIIYIDNFISPWEREYLIHTAEPEYISSRVVHSADPANRAASENRTSKTAYLFHDPIAECIRKRAATFQGGIKPDRIEDLQVLKYDVGGQFRPHWDFGYEEENRRVSTFFAYLACDDPSSRSSSSSSSSKGAGNKCTGGATRFLGWDKKSISRSWCDVVDCDNHDDNDQEEEEEEERVTDPKFEDMGISFKAIPGNAIYWSNVHPNGSYYYGHLREDGNYYAGTMHAGMPVISGRKVGLNIWTRAMKFISPPETANQKEAGDSQATTV